jgi:transcription antitermination factor NusG
MEATECLPWFAAYVKPKHEKMVAMLLCGKGHETFLPTYRRQHKRSKHFDLPLFPGYVFCRCEWSNMLSVLSTPGVFSIVGNGRIPEPVPEEEIENVRRMIQSDLSPCPWPYVSEGHEVSLTSGPLRGLQGHIIDTSQEKWLVVSLQILRRSVAVKLDRASVAVDANAPGSEKHDDARASNRIALRAKQAIGAGVR